jgi:hypothetical protein
MTFAGLGGSDAGATRRTDFYSPVSPSMLRIGLLAVIGAAIAAGFLATGSAATVRAVSESGADLTRLLRAMAAIKMLFAAGAVAAVLWRLGAAITPGRFLAYAAGCAAMAAGPGLIWGMAHVALGAALLHGGLLTTAVLVWRDPATAAELEEVLASRRASIRRVAP